MARIITDKEKLTQLFVEFGIGFEIKDNIQNKRTGIVCTEGDAKVDGYTLFYVVFEFDENGKFLKMGIWE